MNKRELKEILADSKLTDKDIVGKGFEVTAVTKPEWDFVIKLITGIHPDRTQSSYQIATESLGGLIAKISRVTDIPIQIGGTTYSDFYVQQKLLPARAQLTLLEDKGLVHMIGDLVQRYCAAMQSELARGCYKSDGSIDNYGLTKDSRLLLLDLGFIVRDIGAEFPEVRDIYFKGSTPYGKDQRSNQRGMIHYQNLKSLSRIHPELGKIYQATTNMDFDPSVDLDKVDKDDLIAFQDHIIDVLKSMGLVDLSKESGDNRATSLLNIWEGEKTPQRFSLYHALIKNKYACQFNDIAQQELDLYFRPQDPSKRVAFLGD
ncbi:MAG: hypothetical protein ABIJ08_07090 [Nanoarchaeota archaeon]